MSGCRPECEAERIEYWLHTMQGWEQCWQREFARIGADVLTLYYEDFVADQIATLARVHRFLDMAVPPDLDRLRPQLVRQSGAESEAWAKRYLEESAGRVGVPA